MTRRLLILSIVAILFAFFAPSAWADPPTPTDIVAQAPTPVNASMLDPRRRSETAERAGGQRPNPANRPADDRHQRGREPDGAH